MEISRETILLAFSVLFAYSAFKRPLLAQLLDNGQRKHSEAGDEQRPLENPIQDSITYLDLLQISTAIYACQASHLPHHAFLSGDGTPAACKPSTDDVWPRTNESSFYVLLREQLAYTKDLVQACRVQGKPGTS